MMTQEEFMEVQVLRSAGWTIRQIAEHVGYHPATMSVVAEGGRPAGEAVDAGRGADRRRAVAGPDRRVVGAERGVAGDVDHAGDRRRRGSTGRIRRLTRYLRTVRGPSRGRAPAVAMPIETGAG